MYQLTGTAPITLTNVTLDQVPPGAAILSQTQFGSVPTYKALIRIEPSEKAMDLAQQTAHYRGHASLWPWQAFTLVRAPWQRQVVKKEY